MSTTACTAVGFSGDVFQNATAPAFERWNGKSWASQAGSVRRNQQVLAVSCSSPSACKAVGTWDGGRGWVRYPAVWDWNDKHWSEFDVNSGLDPMWTGPVSLDALSCTSRLVCTGVGWGYGQSQALGWDGSRWSVLQTDAAGPVVYDLMSVSCTSDAQCTAVGASSPVDVNSNYFALVTRRNGASWSIEPGLGPGRLLAVSCSSAVACTAVGRLTNSAGHVVPLVVSTVPPA